MKDRRRVGRPIVAITAAEYEGDAIRAALELLPMADLITSSDTVVITPNWVNPRPPQTGAVVGPESLRELIQLVKGRNPRRLVVATGSGGAPTPQVMKAVGYDRILEEEKIEFVDLNYGPYTDTEIPMPGTVPGRTHFNRLYNETDVLISFTQLKVHEEATVSLGLKNIAMGWPPAEIHGFPKKQTGIHTDLHQWIASMAKKFPIDLTILSTDKAMIGTGPSGGVAVDSNLIIAGTDPVATDVIGARLLGFLPQAVQYLYQLILEGIGEGDVKKMDLRGIPLEQAEGAFSQAAYGRSVVVDNEKIRPLPIGVP
ncbi:MAG: DUF362 domain-containing protein [Firmicutes bacterium]|nr:DUF362 domain-containing protein [Bacillota bacterium]